MKLNKLIISFLFLYSTFSFSEEQGDFIPCPDGSYYELGESVDSYRKFASRGRFLRSANPQFVYSREETSGLLLDSRNRDQQISDNISRLNILSRSAFGRIADFEPKLSETRGEEVDNSTIRFKEFFRIKLGSRHADSLFLDRKVNTLTEENGEAYYNHFGDRYISRADYIGELSIEIKILFHRQELRNKLLSRFNKGQGLGFVLNELRRLSGLPKTNEEGSRSDTKRDFTIQVDVSARGGFIEQEKLSSLKKMCAEGNLHDLNSRFIQAVDELKSSFRKSMEIDEFNLRRFTGTVRYFASRHPQDIPYFEHHAKMISSYINEKVFEYTKNREAIARLLEEASEDRVLLNRYLERFHLSTWHRVAPASSLLTWKEKVEKREELLQGNLNKLNIDPFYPVSSACANDRSDIADIERELITSEFRDKPFSCIFSLIREGDLARVSALLNLGFNKNICDPNTGDSQIEVAALSGQDKLVGLYLSHGVDPQMKKNGLNLNEYISENVNDDEARARIKSVIMRHILGEVQKK